MKKQQMTNRSKKKINPKIQQHKETITTKKPFEKIYLFYLILIAGFVLRILFFIEIKNSPFAKVLFSDSLIYFEHAGSMLKNNSLFGSEVFYMSPLYTYFLALLQSLFSDSIMLVRLIQIIISTLTIGFVYLIGKNMHSENAGLIASAICSVYALFIFYSSAVLIETMLAFIVTALFYLLTKENKLFEKKHWFVIGILLGIASILRANILLFFPVIVIWLYFQFKKKQVQPVKHYILTAYFFIGTIIPIAPITIQNYLAEKEFVLITANGGINFYLGNHHDATGIYQNPKDYDLILDLSGKRFAERELKKTLTSAEASSYWYSRGIDFITAEPVNASVLYFKKILLFFSDDENAQSAIMDMDFFKNNYSTVLKITIPGFFIILLFSFAGFILHPFKNPVYKVVVFLLISYILATALFFVVGRFRLIISPVLIVFAGIGIYEIWNIIRTKNFKKFILPASISVILVTLNFTITPKFTYSDYDAYISLGNSYFEKKQFDEALINYNKSLKLKEEASTYVLIANVYSAQKDVNNAMMTYKKAVDLNPQNVLAYFNVGILYTQLTSFHDAIRAFKKAIEIDSNFLPAHKNLAVIYYMAEDYKNSLYYFERVLELSKDNDERTSVLKDIEDIKQKLLQNNN